MTEKEKAEELIEKFGKELAPKVVDEIINSSPSLPILGDGGTFSEDIELSTIYWQEVKQLLNNQINQNKMKEKMLLSEFIKELEKNTNSSKIDQAIFTLRIILTVNGNVQIDLESMKKYTGITI